MKHCLFHCKKLLKLKSKTKQYSLKSGGSSLGQSDSLRSIISEDLIKKCQSNSFYQDQQGQEYDLSASHSFTKEVTATSARSNLKKLSFKQPS
jgi:hypothetical protein